MNIKINIALVVLLGSLLLNGCSSEIAKKQPMYNPNFITTLLHKDVMAEEPARHAKMTMEPAIKLTEAYNKEIEALGGLQSKDLADAAKLKKASEIANKYLPEAKKLQKDMLRWNDAVVPHVRYMQRINWYVGNLVAKLEKTIKLEKEPAKSKQGLLNQINQHARNQKDNLLGFNHYKLILTKGPNAYHLNRAKIRGLKKGMTYEQVANVLQMPGEWQRWGEFIWVHNDAVLFANFNKGKLDYWKLTGGY